MQPTFTIIFYDISITLVGERIAVKVGVSFKYWFLWFFSELTFTFLVAV